MAKSQFLRPKWRNSPFSGVPRGKAVTINQKVVSLQPVKFHVISISVFLPCAILGALGTPKRPWCSVLHQLHFFFLYPPYLQNFKKIKGQ